MVKFRSLRVRSFSLEYFDLNWEIESTLEDTQDWAFYVQRSEAESGDWNDLAGPLFDQFFLRDNTVHTKSETRTWFYRIKAVHQIQGWEVYSETSDVFGPQSLPAAEIIRNEHVLFREHAGIACWLFARRTFGQRCPSCWDPRLQKRTDEQCEVCWGTGFSGGYHRPVKFWGRLTKTDMTDDVHTDDKRQPVYGQLELNPSPTAKPHDLIIDAQNGRYVVTSISETSLLGVTVRQILKMTKVEKGAIADAVPLLVDTATEELRAPRNFTNPQNLDAARDTDLETVLQVWHRY